ncbi:MAG: low-complexity protein [Gammaproteobacteria bacterium]|nr:low-complexity protein [Gammaproteobacteria bacterium]
MSITTNKTKIALAAGTVLSAGLALSPSLVNADTNPFASTELSSGYMQLAEGKCGGNKTAEEGKCGGEKKAEEAKCGADKKAEEGKCGAEKKTEEGKCGEAKCGANK